MANSGATVMPPAVLLGQGLTGEGVLVTGAASGIGRQTIELLARIGAHVCAVDVDAAALEDAVACLPGEARHFAVVLDIADVDAIPLAVADAAARLPSLRALVHAAAYLKREQLDQVTAASWDRHVDVNLKGTFFLNRAVADVMLARRSGGRIVNFASVAWMTGPAFGSDAYVATKAGVVAMSRGFAKRFGPHGITVNVIAPGQIDTPMQRDDNAPAVVEAAIQACPLQRMGDPAEVAAVAVFLASDHASFISGATMNVSGGALLY